MSHLIGFRIKEAARYTGLTVKMVDYLCRREIVVPSTKGKTGRGRARSFTFGDLVFMKILNDFTIDKKFVFPKKFNLYKVLLNNKNIGRFDCIMLPFKGLTKALNI